MFLVTWKLRLKCLKNYIHRCSSYSKIKMSCYTLGSKQYHLENRRGLKYAKKSDLLNEWAFIF